MRVIIEPNYDLMSQWAANHVIERINAAKPTAEKPFVLGLPTGSSPIGMYRALVKACQEQNPGSGTGNPPPPICMSSHIYSDIRHQNRSPIRMRGLNPL